jgi:hypothetical protein
VTVSSFETLTVGYAFIPPITCQEAPPIGAQQLHVRTEHEAD